MRRKWDHGGLIGILILSGLCLYACRTPDDVRIINNESPKYGGLGGLRLEKVNSIDVTEIGMFGRERSSAYGSKIDFDETGRMYILDIYECTISVFDEDGKYLGSLCRKGQGPQELSQPNFLFVGDEIIYVVQNMASQIKSFDLQGEYISTRNITIQNPFRFYAAGGRFYVFSADVDQTFTKLEFKVIRFGDDQFSSGEEIFRQAYPPGLRGPNYDFIWHNWLHITGDGAFYFPEDNLKDFSIVEYDSEGQPALIFRRSYDAKKYTEKAEERFLEIHGRSVSAGMAQFPSHPPVIRKIFVDDRKNVWIISGETVEDNENPDFENTVDIFDQKGYWLRSFKTKEISRNCLYNNGRIYNISTINPITMKQAIDVFRIRLD